MTEPRCGLSRWLGGSASLRTTGARFPVSVAWALDKWAGSSCVSERIKEILCIHFDRCWKCSQICTPGAVVAIGWNGPRMSVGALGFRSKVSRWLGPPHMNRKMQRFAWPKPLLSFAIAGDVCARRRSGNVRPMAPSAPAWSTARREICDSVRNSVQPRACDFCMNGVFDNGRKSRRRCAKWLCILVPGELSGKLDRLLRDSPLHAARRPYNGGRHLHVNQRQFAL